MLVQEKENENRQCQIYYNGEMEDDWLKEKKLAWPQLIELK